MSENGVYTKSKDTNFMANPEYCNELAERDLNNNETVFSGKIVFNFEQHLHFN